MRRVIAEVALRVFPGVLLLLAWEWAVHDSKRLQFLYAAPSLVLEHALVDYANTAIWKDIAITASEALAGLLIGSALGMALGVFLWMFPLTVRISKPYIAALGSIPIFALAPLLIIWFGVGFTPKVIMSAFGVFMVSLVHTFEGVRSTAAEHIDFAIRLGASRFAIFKKVLFPSALQWLRASLQINVGVALLGAFIGEFVSSEAGLGHYIIEAGQLYDMPAVIFGIFNLSLLALLLDAGSRWVIAAQKRY